MRQQCLVHQLFEGPLDLVGDVHGEIDALRALLGHLGYAQDGSHPEGRRLVFLGDLTDRGPDSPAVVDLVQSLVAFGRAQCVLGNHDLNLLLNHPKHENQWFYGEEFQNKNGQVVPQELADTEIRKRVLAFFASLPLALEREDLRVVHACWNEEMLSLARTATNVVTLYHEHADRIELDVSRRTRLDATGRALLHQNNNPVKVLTSGLEERSETPIEAGGKVRCERRVYWWKDYDDVFCVFGHYAFKDGEPRRSESAFCVDYGVGKRWTERQPSVNRGFTWKLAALRFPERMVVFDEGATQSWDAGPRTAAAPFSPESSAPKIIWAISKELARTSRPGYDGTRRAPVERAVVKDWLAEAKQADVRSIICLLADEQLSLYSSLGMPLPEFYRTHGFQVAHVPALDHQWPPLTPESLLQIWEAYQQLPKPVLIHCSAGCDRTGAAVDFILERLKMTSERPT